MVDRPAAAPASAAPPEPTGGGTARLLAAAALTALRASLPPPPPPPPTTSSSSSSMLQETPATAASPMHDALRAAAHAAASGALQAHPAVAELACVALCHAARATHAAAAQGTADPCDADAADPGLATAAAIEAAAVPLPLPPPPPPLPAAAHAPPDAEPACRAAVGIALASINAHLAHSPRVLLCACAALRAVTSAAPALPARDHPLRVAVVEAAYRVLTHVPPPLAAQHLPHHFLVHDCAASVLLAYLLPHQIRATTEGSEHHHYNYRGDRARPLPPLPAALYSQLARRLVETITRYAQMSSELLQSVPSQGNDAAPVNSGSRVLNCKRIEPHLLLTGVVTSSRALHALVCESDSAARDAMAAGALLHLPRVAALHATRAAFASTQGSALETAGQRVREQSEHVQTQKLAARTYTSHQCACVTILDTLSAVVHQLVSNPNGESRLVSLVRSSNVHRAVADILSSNVASPPIVTACLNFLCVASIRAIPRSVERLQPQVQTAALFDELVALRAGRRRIRWPGFDQIVSNDRDATVGRTTDDAPGMSIADLARAALYVKRTATSLVDLLHGKYSSHLKQLRVQQLTCKAIAALAAADVALQNAIGTRDVFAVLLDIIRVSIEVSDSSALDCSMRALAALCDGNQDVAKLAVQSGSWDRVLSVIAYVGANGGFQRHPFVLSNAALTVHALIAVHQQDQSLSLPDVKACQTISVSFLAPYMVSREASPAVNAELKVRCGYAVGALCSLHNNTVRRDMLAVCKAEQALSRAFELEYTIPDVACALLAAVRSLIPDGRGASLLLVFESFPKTLAEALGLYMERRDIYCTAITSVLCTLSLVTFEHVAVRAVYGSRHGIVRQLLHLIRALCEDTVRDFTNLGLALRSLSDLLADCEENTKQWLLNRGLDVFLYVMREFDSYPTLFYLSCEVLRYAFQFSEGVCSNFMDEGGLELLSNGMRHFSRVEKVLAAALRLLCMFGGDILETVDEKVLTRNIYDAVHAMTSFPRSVIICLAACDFLNNICAAHPKTRTVVVACGGRTAIVDVLRTHVSSSKLTESAARALVAMQGVGPSLSKQPWPAKWLA